MSNGSPPLQQGEYLPTGNPEADRVLGRLNSSDPGFDDCAEAAALIYKLVSEIKGPEGFATWKDAAIASRGAAQADTVFQCGKAAGRQEMKEAQQSSDFNTWVHRAYRVPYPATYTLYNMEVAYQAGRESAAQAAPAEIDAKTFQSYAETRAYSKGYYAGKKAAQAAPDVVEGLIRERDHRDAIIDVLCDAVLEEDRPEWSSSYYFEDAVVAVQERIAELEAREECRDSNAQAAPAPVAEDAEDGARFRAMVNAAFTGFEAFERVMHAASETEPETIDDFRVLVDKARAQAAQPEGGAK